MSCSEQQVSITPRIFQRSLFYLLLLLVSIGLGTHAVEGGVEVQICVDSGKNENAWTNEVVLTYEESAFAFSGVPQAYTDSGIRDDWPNPFRVAAEAEVDLPKGTHRLLLRSRRAARVWMDGRLIVENPFPPRISDGHDPVVYPFLQLGKGVRFPGPGDMEELVEVNVSKGKVHFRLEFFVGGWAGKRAMRPETGETLVAISLEGERGFQILSPEQSIPLTDAGWESFYREQQARLANYNRQRRHELRAKQNRYWKKRHAWARDWVQGKEGAPFSSIDEFLTHRIETTNAVIDPSPEALHFIDKVRPVLQDRCWSCHGKGDKGDLRLDSKALAMTGGGSGIPALVPGNAEESYLLELVLEEHEEDRMPPKGDPLSEQEVNAITQWIEEGAVWPETVVTSEIDPVELTEDWQFLRRVYLDTVGLPPTESALKEFVEDRDPEKRAQLIDELLNDPRWADHWVSYWQDVLAENPTVVNPTLNNTGPFRFWIYEALQDDLPMDRFVTELVSMEGSQLGGGTKGFEMASQNDVPMAAKANILATAFLGTEMQCSRCHDAPFHSNTQEDLFSLAALLAQESLTVPASSSVPMDKLHAGGRQPLIEVTLPPGSEVDPKWPFEDRLSDKELKRWLRNPDDTREVFALQLTGPHDKRFAKVMANRLWQRLFGRGIVEPIDDWENAEPLYPDLLEFLANEFVKSGYRLKSLARLILNSQAYQRKTSEDLTAIQYFAAQGPRQLSAEQIVDSLFAATGKPLETETLTVDIGGGRPWHNAMSLGKPHRAWMFGGMANNRDRASLVLPRAQAVIDVLTAFGWRASRQEPRSYRDSPLSPLKPAILNNGTMVSWLVRLSEDHELTELSLKDQTPEKLVDSVYLRLLNRYPSEKEKALAVEYLTPGFDDRVTSEDQWLVPEPPDEPELFVTWANHLDPKADLVALEKAEQARRGDPPTSKLIPDWRERMEDLVWTLINLPEAIYYP